VSGPRLVRDGSYTTKLLAAGWQRIAEKIGEEALEAALAGAGGRDVEVVEEMADLLYHVLVMLKARGLGPNSVVAELRKRHEARR
jgi:phosphoribosyl-ATP pyrophosphohydrolase/phosphoribosyl-AMP cyclohydrolase